MTYSRLMLAPLVLIAATPVYAGAEMDMVTKDASGVTIETMKVFAQAGMIRMDDNGNSPNERSSVLFRDQEFVMLSHNDRSYMILDEATMARVGSEVDAAMQQMQAELAGMPPEQRAMVEQMMKGQMGGMMGGQEAPPPPPPTIQKIGSGEWKSESCTQYAVYDGGQKTQEICAAPLGDVDGSDEMMRAFKNMAAFLRKIAESMPGPMAASMAENPMGFMEQIQGFPVRTVQFENGQVSTETTLESVIDRALEEALFGIPADYTRQDPFAGR